ncbi:hypothetical protein HMPREF0262_01074 [Clostridium sp. ATCC 29733]|nr:hypothetical protein HMPREF0262_01074 [Clostridium sp. ATCC 29733]
MLFPRYENTAGRCRRYFLQLIGRPSLRPGRYAGKYPLFKPDTFPRLSKLWTLRPLCLCSSPPPGATIEVSRGHRPRRSDKTERGGSL